LKRGRNRPIILTKLVVLLIVFFAFQRYLVPNYVPVL
jgi:hypothetical protein